MKNPFIQTKHDQELGNIALVYVSHVLSAAKFDLFHTCATIGHHIAELNQTFNQTPQQMNQH